MFCPNCGKENPYDANFCLECGTNIAAYHSDTKPTRYQKQHDRTVSFEKLKQQYQTQSSRKPFSLFLIILGASLIPFIILSAFFWKAATPVLWAIAMLVLVILYPTGKRTRLVFVFGFLLFLGLLACVTDFGGNPWINGAMERLACNKGDHLYIEEYTTSYRPGETYYEFFRICQDAEGNRHYVPTEEVLLYNGMIYELLACFFFLVYLVKYAIRRKPNTHFDSGMPPSPYD
jgi:hypothetical protein